MEYWRPTGPQAGQLLRWPLQTSLPHQVEGLLHLPPLPDGWGWIE